MNVKKRIVPIFVAALMVFTMMPMMAGSAYADEIYITYEGLGYKIENNGHVVFTGVEDENAERINRTTGELTIHTDYYGYWVMKIGKYAFANNLPSGINTVIIPDKVMEIEEMAFYQCSGLKSISFPRFVEKIGTYAFFSCPFLETVSFEDEGYPCYIDNDAFSGCWNLKEVTIPTRVYRINSGAFDGCDALTTVHYGGTRQQWEAIEGRGKPPIDLVEFNYPIPQEIKANGTSIKDLKSAKKAVTVKWEKQPAKINGSHITGYQIRVATNKKFTKNKKTVTVKGYKTVSKKIKNLKSKKRYYVKIRTYKSVGGEKYYSPWSKAKSVKTR